MPQMEQRRSVGRRIGVMRAAVRPHEQGTSCSTVWTIWSATGLTWLDGWCYIYIPMCHHGIVMLEPISLLQKSQIPLPRHAFGRGPGSLKPGFRPKNPAGMTPRGTLAGGSDIVLGGCREIVEHPSSPAGIVPSGSSARIRRRAHHHPARAAHRSRDPN